MIDVFITHFLALVGGAADHARGFNEILRDEIMWIRHVTPRSDYRLTVVYYTDNIEGEAHLKATLPVGVRLVKNDRPGRPDIQPSLRNKVLDVARAHQSECAVLLHNDVRVAHGWLDRLEADLAHGERLHGRGQVLVSPRCVPYHYADPGPVEDADFWEALRSRVASTGAMRVWCKPFGFAMHGDELMCPAWTPPTPDGHVITMWITRPAFFDRVGECDEIFTGADYDDSDWGMRAWMAGKCLFQSRSALVGHVERLSFSPNAPMNTEMFVAKWGQAVFDELRSGAIWPRLRKARGIR